MSIFSLKKRGITGWKRILIISLIVVIAFVVIVIIFISPISKHLIEKYDVKYTGREIETGLVYVNPFTGVLRIGDLKVYEPESDSIFLSAAGIRVNVSMFKLFSKTYEISSLTLNKPYAIIIKDKDRFNFSDLLEKADTTKEEEESKEPLRLSVLDIEINNGVFRYNELQTPVDYLISDLDFQSDGKYWDSDSIDARFSFIPGKGPGGVKGDFWMDMNKNDFRLSSAAEKLNIDLFEQYFKDFANYGTIRATFGFDMQAIGNFNNYKNIKLAGRFEVDDFHLGKDPDEDYTSFEKFKVTITDLEPLNQKYYLDSVLVRKPFFIYEAYDTLSNVERIFGDDGENVKAVKADPEKFNLILELAEYIKKLFRDMLKSDYKVNFFSVENGEIQYDDYSLTEKFSLSLQPFNIKANFVDKEDKKVNVVMESKLRPYGSLKAEIGMDPKNDRNYYLTYSFDKIPATVFNPYIITYSSFPLDRGLIDINGEWKILGDSIRSTNHFIALDPRVSQRVRKKDTKWLPMPLIMSFVRERGNVIDYEIPIRGSLKDPKFKFTDVILDLIKNLFLKPPTTPYAINVRNAETEIEKSLILTWPTRYTELEEPDDRFAEKIAKFLKDNKEASINVKPFHYERKEKEYILFFEAKKRYFLSTSNKTGGSISEKDSLKIDKMSTKDPAFTRFLNKNTKDSMVFTRQEKCLRLIGQDLVDNKFNQLIRVREKAFLEYFKKKEVEKQVNFLENENGIPFNGFSYYKIEYKGDIPKSLERAYDKLRELNTEPPRRKYQPLRKTEPGKS